MGPGGNYDNGMCPTYFIPREAGAAGGMVVGVGVGLGAAVTGTYYEYYMGISVIASRYF